ncbi:MAG TPA: phosphatase PAP2 family protein [Sediminibacterium sp.]|nr:phosphatase PAP2 family protein [Sediminibacterium sp.]
MKSVLVRKTGSLLLGLLLIQLTTQAQASWEVTLLHNINPPDPNSAVWKGFSNTAKPIAAGIPAGLLVIALLEKNHPQTYQAVEMLGGLAITTIATEGLKQIVKRPRPYQTYPDIHYDQYDNSPSFPSGHVSVAFSTATSLWITTHHWWIGVPALAWATGVGYSRMYLGQHYPSDVLAGAAIGVASAWAAHWLRHQLFDKKK